MDKITAVRKAIHFKGPDHVPLWSGAPDTDIVSVCSGRMPIAGMTGGAIKSDDGRQLQVIGADGVAVTPEEARAGAPDDWSCTWRSLDDTRGQVVVHPVVEWDDVDKLNAPDPHRKGLYDDAVANIRSDGGEHYMLAVQWSILLERMEYICSFQKLMEGLYIDRPKVERLADMVTEWSIGTVEHFADIGVHGVIIGDDWGSQIEVFIEPSLWREVFQPRYTRIVAAAHRKGVDVFFHSCGNVFKVIPGLIDCGIDVMNTWQPKVIGLDKLAKAFAGRICFQCSADLQQTLPSATPQQVREETRILIRSLSSPRGGLIGVDYAGSTVSVENVDAMLEAFREHGRYPENADR